MKQITVFLFLIWTVLTITGCTTPVASSPLTTTAAGGLTPSATASHIPTTTPPFTKYQMATTIPAAQNTPASTTAADPLVQHILERINLDRTQNGLLPVVLGNNPAAQNHAEDMFANFYLSHWDTDGLKPYMRYTLTGGIDAEGENSAYYGWFDKSEDASRYVTIDPQQILEDLENQMMYDDAGSNWGHRNNILNKWHKKVNIGIAYDSHRLTLVQQFEGDYISFTQTPKIENGDLVASGSITLGTIDSLTVYYDPAPKPMTQAELTAGPGYYDMGKRVATIVPPPPPGYAYSGLPDDTVQAEQWDTGESGSFSIKAYTGAMLDQNGPGVYTVVFRSKTDNEYALLTNYSVFIR